MPEAGMDNLHINLSDPTPQKKFDPVGQRVRWRSAPHVFAVVTLLLVARFDWSLRWLVSGAPMLSYAVFLGSAQGNRFLPFIPLWTFFATLNLACSIAASVWPLYWVFVAGCYPLILLSCIFQFDPFANFARRQLRALLKDSHFIKDKVALFNLPALEIDTELDGLVVIRGVTVSLSSLTLVAHGVEIAIKLPYDMELALTTDKVTVSLFRKIEVEDVFANLKGGEYEQSFGDVVDEAGVATKKSTEVSKNQSSLLRAATLSAEHLAEPMVEDTDEMSNTLPRTTSKIVRKPVPKPSSTEAALGSVQALSPAEDSATDQYEAALKQIVESSLVAQSREKISVAYEENKERDSEELETPIDRSFDPKNDKHMRAAICARLHDKASIPHPPQTSITVTTLRSLSSPASRKFMHRLPMLLRLMLSLLSYFHPITITSVTAGGSGKWLQHMLSTHVFKHYSENNADIRRLQARVYAWLSGANFVLQLDRMSGLAHVPFFTSVDIESRVSIADAIVYRTLPNEISLAQVIRLRGADASMVIPTFLLPHHEHLLPPKPTKADEEQKEKEVDEMDSIPHIGGAIDELDQTRRDETTIKVSGRARLPAVFDQQLLDFIAALVKVTKFIEIEKSFEDKPTEDDLPPTPTESELDEESPTNLASRPNFKDNMKALNTNFKGSMKTFNKKMNTGMEKTWRRGIVGGMANDRWIAKLVGKVMRLLETVKGDVGYSGEIPVPLEGYRSAAEPESKLLA
jgi:hypothetical protein